MPSLCSGRTEAAGRCRCHGGRVELLELDLGNIARGFCGLKAGALLKLEDAGKDVSREGLDGVVVVEHAVVVALARVRNLVLGILERRLKLHEVRVRLKVGIRLGDSEELAKRAGKHVVGGHLVFWRCRGAYGIARGYDRVECRALVCGIAFDGFHQVGDKVTSTLQLRVDVLPCVVDAVAQRDHVVVQARNRGADDKNDDDDDDDRNHGLSISNVARRLVGDISIPKLQEVRLPCPSAPPRRPSSRRRYTMTELREGEISPKLGKVTK